MQEINNDYRVHVTVRLKGEQITSSNEFKTENFEDLEEMCNMMKHFALDTITDLEDGEGTSDE